MECVVVDTHQSRLAKMRSGVLTSCRLHDTALAGKRYWSAFVTLTFRPGEDFQPKRISTFLQTVKAWCSRHGLSNPRYVWSAELQRRGTLHYHLLLWLPRGLMLPKPDKRGWWPWGSSRIERARHAGAYLAKYVSKGGGAREAFPKGARIHGAGGFSAMDADERRWWMCPSWVREVTAIDDRPYRSSGGGFVCRGTGLVLSSPWRVVGIAGGFVRLVAVEVT